jgi:hypothetical protein
MGVWKDSENPSSRCGERLILGKIVDPSSPANPACPERNIAIATIRLINPDDHLVVILGAASQAFALVSSVH